MANKEKYTKEYIVEKGKEFIKENGFENFNARSFANYMGMSTQPIFRCYPNMQNFKREIYEMTRDSYLEYVFRNIDEENYLLTMLYYIIMFAKYNNNLYKFIFYSEFIGTRTIDEINNSIWNGKAIEIIMKKYSINKKECEEIYRDLRFYIHGIATQLATKTLKIEDDDIRILLKNIINKLLKKEE